VDVPLVTALDVADSRALRKTFATFPTGVTVVTVGGPTPHGMTANSFTTVSLDPPLVLVCVDRRAVMHGLLEEAGEFAVSVLAAEQENVARYFSDRRRPVGHEQFQPIDTLPGSSTEAPLIAGALAHFECRVRHRYDGGDHTIVVGHLLSLDRGAELDALVFHSGGFGHSAIRAGGTA
jgi:flavin reductase